MWIQSIQSFPSKGVHLKNEGTGIEVRVVDKVGKPVKDSLFFFLGNYNSPGQPGVRDRISVRTDNHGKAFLSFSGNSIVTAFWFIAFEKDGLITEYRPVNIFEGEIAVSYTHLTLPTTPYV